MGEPKWKNKDHKNESKHVHTMSSSEEQKDIQRQSKLVWLKQGETDDQVLQFWG